MENKRRKRSSINPSLILILVGALFLIIAAIFMLTQNQQRTVLQPTQAADIPYPDIKRISLPDAKAAYDQGTAVFLDVRSAESFDSVHIKDAISLPETELESRWTELSADKLIITYCT
jgi:hypothetical protein